MVATKTTSSVDINNSTYTNICNVIGDRYAAGVRISLQGTQHTKSIQPFTDDTRLRQLGITLEQWRGLDVSKPLLVCPPTPHSTKFWEISQEKWDSLSEAKKSKCLASSVKMKSPSSFSFIVSIVFSIFLFDYFFIHFFVFRRVVPIHLPFQLYRKYIF